ncbi:GNAT family N-acetyltransferase [Nocardiopsis sediminis]|uniref:GNAT family N-acetyltransferase n=1 Tax=Nocardiopsis sediminis TaxID=1778267 RepID=A0ABV8FHT6_9ACTN
MAAAPLRIHERIGLLRLDGAAPDVAEARAAVLRLRLAPGQRAFTADAAANLPRADADPGRTPFAVLRRGVPVGFGIIDRRVTPGIATGDPGDAVMLRAFYVAPEWQGQGIGRAACMALGPLVGGIAPEAREVLVTAAESNHAALRAYRAGGFAPTGRQVVTADAAVQLVLRRPVG